MDKPIARAAERPLVIPVVDLEADIGRDPAGLDLTQVRPYYGGRGVEVAHLDAPDARPRPEVEDAAGGVADGG